MPHDDSQSMFPAKPADLSTLTDEELAELKEQFKQVAKAIRDKDEETLGDRSAEEIVAEMTAGVEAIEEITAEIDQRAEAQENFERELETLAARAGADAETDPDPPDDGGDEGDGDESAETPEAQAEETPAETREPVAAAATRPVRRPLPAARRHKPRTDQTPGAALLASSQVHPYAETGERLNRRRLGEVFSDLVQRSRVNYGQRIVVASANYDYPPERILGRNAQINYAAITEVGDAMLTKTREALVASGGLCAPLTPIYDMPDVETASRPVRDALANFRADRGGVIVPTNPTLVDYEDAVGVVTAADDEQGGTFAVKSCMRIECPDFPEVVVDSIYACIEAGNLTARAYPELMSRIDTLVSSNQARLADGKLLTEIKAGSTAVTDVNTTSTAGAMWKLLEFVHVAADAMRSRHRMSDNARLRALFPEWIIGMLTVDLARNGNDSDRFKTRQQIESILGQAGINVTFYKDSPDDGTGQIFGAQAAGNLLGYPSATQWALYPEGSWLHLDSGQLDLGIVRDSTLNSTNDFQIFAETWEQAAFVGVESQWHTATLAPNGTNSAPKDYSASTNF